MFSIIEFCEFAGISRSLYYSLKSDGDGPAETRLRGRVLIRKETAVEWLKSREGKSSIV